MNRLEIGEEIKRRVPVLSQRDKKRWDDGEKLREQFVADYPISKIKDLSLDEYVIGKGGENKSFCYRIERETDTLGRILGTQADRFGLYYGVRKKDPIKKYRHAKKWGETTEEAFISVKQAIVDLLEAAKKQDTETIEKSRLSPLFKGKLTFLYYPNQFAPIYSEKHLKHFIAELNLNGEFKRCSDMQKALADYQSSWPELSSESPLLYMRLLYELFPYSDESPKEKGASKFSEIVPLLDVAVAGASIISELPETSLNTRRKLSTPQKADYERQQKSRSRTGNRGEHIVLELERKRLAKSGKPDLAKRIKHTSQEDDRAGYDIHSFELDGTDRFIEVKATSAKDSSQGFYISANELEKSKSLSNYYIYLVFSALTTKPCILPIKQPSEGFVLSPILFHVDLIPLPNNESCSPFQANHL